MRGQLFGIYWTLSSSAHMTMEIITGEWMKLRQSSKRPTELKDLTHILDLCYLIMKLVFESCISATSAK